MHLPVAGQPAVRATAAECLRRGRPYLMTSIGALTDDALRAELHDLAASSRVQLHLCAGAMPAVDWMASAALAHAAKTRRKGICSSWHAQLLAEFEQSASLPVNLREAVAPARKFKFMLSCRVDFAPVQIFSFRY